MTEQSSPSSSVRRAVLADLPLVQQISADAYISAYMPVLGYIPKPAEEDYGPRIDRREVWILECNGSAVGTRPHPSRAGEVLVDMVRPVAPRERN